MNRGKQVKEEIFRQLECVRQAGFGHLTPALRTALFHDKSQIDWDNVAKVWMEENPEWAETQPTVEDVAVNPYLAAFVDAEKKVRAEFVRIANECSPKVIAELPTLLTGGLRSDRQRYLATQCFGEKFVKLVELYHLANKAMQFKDKELSTSTEE